jgi:hypothetical protein
MPPIYPISPERSHASTDWPEPYSGDDDGCRAQCYYRLVREALAAGEPGPSAPLGAGAIVELGAWLGASTAYIAAAIRDSGSDKKVHVFDKFQSKPGHERKVSAFYEKHGTTSIPIGPSLEQFRANLGELMRHVRVQRGQIEAMEWDPAPDGHGGPIAVLITDAPKRVPAISAVLTRLREAIVAASPGTIMAWQDFCHFPSYEIPACLYRLRDHLELVEAVVPGTTLVFRVKSQWTAEEVSPRRSRCTAGRQPRSTRPGSGGWRTGCRRRKPPFFAAVLPCSPATSASPMQPSPRSRW